jgi:hypothetical protein
MLYDYAHSSSLAEDLEVTFVPQLIIMDHEGQVLTKHAQDELSMNNALSYLYYLKSN